ncbi:MAG: NAD(P)/FAD-dependent oxidoreductase [Candidatus Actinomarina sp.]|jgi:geranylgeranyl reductase family protein|nr:NAD(P)/FAD-dependent oxidoreductase [Actinomycetota bacterium]MBL6833158.1 NAD(P)/FAD-dependent oxidoreductase [Candidatus Actinomarina sp.]MBL6836575.1 NAD(P)/FAD-dependent oxidoreductase [Candidatus Actinomarina sp.]
MINSKQYDVIIVGAGPAGSNTAISYKHLNPDLNIAIFDKSQFPRDKSCGDAIGPGVINALKRFGNEHILNGEPEVVSTTLFGPKNIGIQNYIPEVKNKEDSVVYVIPRLDLDNRIFDLAKSLDVDSYEEYRYLGFDRTKDKKIAVTFKNSDGEEETYLTKILVGADGANSRVRKNLNLNQNTDWHKAIAIRAYIDSPNYLEIFKERSLMFEINVSALRGYAWAFPSKDTLINIGIGMPLSLFKKENKNINEMLNDFVETLESRGVIVDNIRMEKSYMLPFASSRPKLAHDQVALVGDAGSMINPMSGEGIFYGMESGFLLAENTHNFLKNENEKINQGIRAYEKSFNKRFSKHYLSCALARLVLQSPFMTQRLLAIASIDQHTIDFVVELLFDEARLTIKEVVLLGSKFLLPLWLLKLLKTTN